MPPWGHAQVPQRKTSGGNVRRVGGKQAAFEAERNFSEETVKKREKRPGSLRAQPSLHRACHAANMTSASPLPARGLVAFAALAMLATAAGAAAPPYWPRYSASRAVSLLDGEWDFALMDRPAHFDSMDPAFGPSSPAAATPNKTNVPSCMDVAPPGYLGSRGIAFYRTTFQHTGAARLQFQACSFYCRVWVNGKEVGDHRAGGYVAFTLDVPESLVSSDGANELFVLADNRFNSTTAPMHTGTTALGCTDIPLAACSPTFVFRLRTGGDFWHYGGLMRSVELHTLPAAGQAWPWRAYILPVSLSTVNVTVHLTDSAFSGAVDVSLAFDGGTVVQHTATAKDGRLSISGVAVPNPRVWTTTDPQLHTATVTINSATVTERFGLRVFGVDANARLTLNGHAIKLTGWNHHTQWPGTGAAPTDEQIDEDIALLLRGGTNYVRGAHYPQDPRWLDKLDENGIVMWEETLGPGVSSKNAQDWDFFMKYQLIQLNEMLDNALNHASIMTWAWFNEGPSSDPAACPAYKANKDAVMARDATRFVTWASDKDLGDKCLEHATLVSFNNYPKWYNSEDPAHQWNKFANSVKAGDVDGALGKPFVISETGAGGIYEWSHNKTDAKWTLL